MHIKAINYHSPNYGGHAKRLIESCHKWGVDIDAQPVKAFRTWHHGVSCKPRYIRHCMELFADYDGLLWLDADAEIMRHLPLKELEGADVAATRFQWSPAHKLEILTGTMFFAISDRTKIFVDNWTVDTRKFTHSDTPEQDALTPLIHSWRNQIFFKDLGVEWTWIDDEKVRDQFPHGIPIVKHYQASRMVRAEEARRAQGQA